MSVEQSASVEQLTADYRLMLLIRRCEEAIGRLLNEGLVHGTAHLSIGLIGASGIVGGGLPIAAGSAWAAQVRGTDQVAIAEVLVIEVDRIPPGGAA